MNNKLEMFVFLFIILWMLFVTFVKFNDNHRIQVLEEEVKSVKLENDKINYFLDHMKLDTITIKLEK